VLADTLGWISATSPTASGSRCGAGLEAFQGDAVAIVMADGSDDPSDLVLYHELVLEGFDCAFGSRFLPGATVTDCPRVKLVINRIVNSGIWILFRHRYNDTTNALKAYRREVVDGIQPLLSNHFNLAVELPLKAIVRGYSYAVVPTPWRGRSGAFPSSTCAKWAAATSSSSSTSSSSAT
jgi:dolichol-phosphate mannosyltransferase